MTCKGEGDHTVTLEVLEQVGSPNSVTVTVYVPTANKNIDEVDHTEALELFFQV